MYKMICSRKQFVHINGNNKWIYWYKSVLPEQTSLIYNLIESISFNNSSYWIQSDQDVKVIFQPLYIFWGGGGGSYTWGSEQVPIGQKRSASTILRIPTRKYHILMTEFTPEFYN